jgi:hypothetical protein
MRRRKVKAPEGYVQPSFNIMGLAVVLSLFALAGVNARVLLLQCCMLQAHSVLDCRPYSCAMLTHRHAAQLDSRHWLP